MTLFLGFMIYFTVMLCILSVAATLICIGKGDLLLGSVPLIFAFFLLLMLIPTTRLFDSEEAIKQCEAELPRNVKCVTIAVPEGET